MTDDHDLEMMLMAARPEAPRDALRERILPVARAERSGARRRRLRGLAIAAAGLLAVAVGLGIESREIDRTVALVDGVRESVAARETDALARDLGGVPGAEGLVVRLRFAAGQARAHANPAAWAERINRELAAFRQ